jgi:DNA processing protein
MSSELFSFLITSEGGTQQPPRRDATEESVAFLAIAAVDGVGYKTLLNIFKSGQRFHDMIGPENQDRAPQLLQDAGIKNWSSLAHHLTKNYDVLIEKGRSRLAELEANGVKLLHSFEESFPHQLRTINDAPGWLFVQGNTEILTRPSVALVGTRDADDFGIFLTHCICYLLAKTDICTVSGLAEGIDSEAHYASLCADVPTIAVLGTGIFQNYPKSAVGLRERILRQGGCIVSEYLPDDGANKQSFVWRNRLQAGLARLTVPAQWRLRSGTAHTVRYSFENHRPVVAVRLPFNHTEETDYLESKGMRSFVLPDQSQELKDYILASMGG